MKKIILLILILLIYKANTFSEDAYINIPKVSTVIGNDKFKALRNSFTGVAGETAEKKTKYFRKEHDVVLHAYNIKKYLITDREFSKFLNTSIYRTSYEKEKGVEYKQVLNNLDTPVKRISFFDAVAYCQWYSDLTGKTYRLPTSAEWEYAAIADSKQIFPWGNESKILPSLNTDSIVGRENFSVYQVPEDVSKLGMANLMGGVEYTLDCYDERFYENSPSENPVCLVPYNAMCVMRGIREYNNLENDVFGLYDLTWNSIDSYNGYSYFRLVEDLGVTFNKGTSDESIYSPKIGKAEFVKLYKHPQVTNDFIECECISDVFILFENTWSTFYRCFVQTYETNILGNLEKTWKIGWVEAKNINLTSKKWYES
ncbi:formylglycine-generating enzyme family protein [Treponema maltophilum]|uniref:formylglycine-generating enzyme family protein n=1 Tax=Treponema maltophilum TaxID=51160 RepID=UPI003D8A18FB